MTQPLPPLAPVESLADWIEEEIPVNSAAFKRAEAVLSMASSLVRKETKRSWLNIAKTDVVDEIPDEVVQVCVQAAARKYTNPDDFEQERQDDFYGARKVQEAGVYLTESEKSLLAEYAGNLHGGLRTITTTRDDFPAFDDSILTGDPILPPYYL